MQIKATCKGKLELAELLETTGQTSCHLLSSFSLDDFISACPILNT